MLIRYDVPPNFDKILEKFPSALKEGVLFTYGDTIYNPAGWKIPRPIVLHEEVHERQQRSDPESWWDKYLIDPKFRYEQELEAHRVEYREYCKRKSSGRAKYFKFVASRLSSELYGNCISLEEAELAILS